MNSFQHHTEIEASRSAAKENTDSVRLRPLTPQYDEAHHEAYVEYLRQALDDPDVHNIALSGPYGVGKSSILRGLKKYRPDATFISLSTLGVEIPGDPTHDQSADSDSMSDEVSHIQKEIVKQLLYQTNPRRLPASRFKRIYRVPRGSHIITSAVVAAAMTLVAILLSLPEKIPPISGIPWCDFLVKLVFIWLIFSLFVAVIGRGFQEHIQLEKVTAGPTTISLSAGAETYFDKYLDELIYFFEITKKGLSYLRILIVLTILKYLKNFENLTPC